MLSILPDPRRQDRVVYPKENLVWACILLFLLALKSRRQFSLESRSSAFAANLNSLAETNVETAPHGDTINAYLKRVDPQALRALPVKVLRHLIRMKTLDRWRVQGKFLVAVDGTGQLVFRERHCPYCLTRKGSNGEILYYHTVLEAKLITGNGFAFSMGTEFIENRDPNATKQDCELKAFKRLASRLKADFPQLPIIVLGDALYACAPVFTICRQNKWGFMGTFKEGRLPALFEEFETLRDLSPKNRKEFRDGKKLQRFAWVNDMIHESHRVSVIECQESAPHGEGRFAWVTNMEVGCASVITLANGGGRLRWKIENEGFNTQKNHGYNLEHAYTENENANKNFYFLLQVAHAINQLMVKGSLLTDFRKTIGSLRNYYRRLAECFRMTIIDPAAWNSDAARSIQIRLDTS